MDEGCDVEGVSTSLDSVVTVSENESELCKIAEQIGPVMSGSDGEEFRMAVRDDESLKEWRELGDRKERGFSWKKGVLVKSLYVTWEEFRDVLVVSSGYRNRIKVRGTS